MSEEIDSEAIADLIEQTATGELPPLARMGFKVSTLSDLGEIYLRTPGGKYFRLTCETVTADDIEGWGIEFDDGEAA